MKCSPALLAAALLLTGCGQKGPLLLPDSAKTKRTMPALPAGFRLAPGAPQQPVASPIHAPAQPGEDAAPVSSPPVTPATTSPR